MHFQGHCMGSDEDIARNGTRVGNRKIPRLPTTAFVKLTTGDTMYGRNVY